MAGSDTPPTETGRFTLESNGFRYEVFRSYGTQMGVLP